MVVVFSMESVRNMIMQLLQSGMEMKEEQTFGLSATHGVANGENTVILESKLMVTAKSTLTHILKLLDNLDLNQKIVQIEMDA